jgi:hypothetical protein
LEGVPKRLSKNQGENSQRDRHWKTFEAFSQPLVFASHQRKEGRGAGEKTSGDKVCATVWVNRQGTFAGFEPCKRFIYNFLDYLSWDIPKDVETPWIRTADEAEMGKTLLEEMNRGVFKTMVAANVKHRRSF